VFTLADSTDDKGIVDYVFKWGSGYGTTFGEDINVELTPSVGYPINTGVVTIEVTVTDGDGAFSNASYEFDTSRPISHGGVNYYNVISPHTGRSWLDRNIGASRVCQTYNDSLCTGGYFQYGRGLDGHQLPSSPETNVLFDDIDNTTNAFVFNANQNEWTTDDSDVSIRHARWQATDGSSVCPAGFRVPTIDELTAETVDVGVNGSQAAFDSFLKLPTAGIRLPDLDPDGNHYDLGIGSIAWYWSTDPSFDSGSAPQRALSFSTSYLSANQKRRDEGMSVRCIAE
jgi:hypothetical protein